MKILIYVIGIIGLAFVLALICSLPIMFLWNYLMPELFDLQEIGWWQAFCISLLCALLFKSPSSSSKD